VGTVRDALAAVAAVEWIAVALALAYLLLAVRQHIACWLFAAASSAVFFWLFARASLPMQAALQVFYIAMAAYGWHSWRGRRSRAGATRPVIRWTFRQHLGAVVWIVLLSLASAFFAPSAETATVRYLDALISWGSVFTTWLVARKVLENWLYWIVLDLLAAAVYWSQGLQATAILFVLYSGIAVQGYRSWRATAPAPRPGPAAA
jgi:nicotinamide mononucleotide transporter